MPSRPRFGCARRWASLRRRLAGMKTVMAMAGVLKIPIRPAGPGGAGSTGRNERTRSGRCAISAAGFIVGRIALSPCQRSRPRRRDCWVDHRHRHLPAAGAVPGGRAHHRGDGGRTPPGWSYPLRDASVRDRAGTVRSRQGPSARHDRRSSPRPTWPPVSGLPSSSRCRRSTSS